MSLIPAFGRQRQMGLREFKISLVYRASFRTARTVTEKSCLRKRSKLTTTEKEERRNSPAAAALWWLWSCLVSELLLRREE